MTRGSYYTALELIRSVLADRTLPAASRLAITLVEVRALLGVGRPCEAAVRLYVATTLMNQHGLYGQSPNIKELASLVENAVTLTQNVGGAGC